MRHNKVTIQKQYKILTVDDDSLMTSTVQAYFRRNGYVVDAENDPYMAIDRVKNGNYDILLLDFLMSPICGDQVVEEIRNFNKDIFIILLTGHKSMAPPIDSIRKLDIQGYYEKSDRFDQLELLVESCVKSITQMRMVKEYEKGLSHILEELPRLYNIHSPYEMSLDILEVVKSIFMIENCYINYSVDDGQEISASTTEGLQDGENKYIITAAITDDENKKIGVMGMETKNGNSVVETQLLCVLAKQISSVISSNRLNARLEGAFKTLEKGYLETISTLRLIVETRDIETRGHSDRVSAIAVMIGNKLGLSQFQLERLKIAGLFHDIGKIGIPDSVLLKNGSLTDDEYDIVKKHPVVGAEIITGISGLKDLVPVVRGHHERIDGNGYPDGLEDGEIPLNARIIAVADSFDAMVSNRSYREGMSVTDAIEELKDGKYKQFDEKIVDVFLDIIEEIGEENFLQSVGEKKRG